MPLRLRPVTPADEEFLYSVYAGTRVDEMNLVPWTAEQKEAFLRMQFEAQARYYAENYPGADFQIILLDDHPVGRLYVHGRGHEIRIIDITLLPESRKLGIGTRLLNQILDEARTGNRNVTIHVERMNPALNLYQRLGFHLIEDKGVYLLLEWTPMTMEQHAHAG